MGSRPVFVKDCARARDGEEERPACGPFETCVCVCACDMYASQCHLQATARKVLHFSQRARPKTHTDGTVNPLVMAQCRFCACRFWTVVHLQREYGGLGGDILAG